MVAAAITAYDGNKASIEDPTIGELNFYLKSWGPLSINPLVKLETEICTAEHFNNIDGTNDRSYFFKLHR